MKRARVPVEVEHYFADLSAERRAVLYPVVETVWEAMPPGYELGLYGGMPSFVVPVERYSTSSNTQPLAYVSLAAQTNYNSLYLMGLSSDPEADAAFRAEWAATGRALNMRTSCLRFNTLADIDLDLIARTVASVSVDDLIARYERQNGRP